MINHLGAPLFAYGADQETELQLSLPATLRTNSLNATGGDVEGDSGQRAAFVVRRDEFLHFSIRFYETEWPDVVAWIDEVMDGQLFRFYPDTLNEPGDGFWVSLESPAVNSTYRATPDPDYPRVLLLPIVLQIGEPVACEVPEIKAIGGDTDLDIESRWLPGVTGNGLKSESGGMIDTPEGVVEGEGMTARGFVLFLHVGATFTATRVITGLTPNTYYAMRAYSALHTNFGDPDPAATVSLGHSSLPPYKTEAGEVPYSEGQTSVGGVFIGVPVQLSGWSNADGEMEVTASVTVPAWLKNAIFTILIPKGDIVDCSGLSVPVYEAPYLDSVTQVVAADVLTLTANLDDVTSAIEAGFAVLYFQTRVAGVWTTFASYTKGVATGTASVVSTDVYKATFVLPGDGSSIEWRVLIQYYDESDVLVDGDSQTGLAHAAFNFSAVILSNDDFVTDSSGNILYIRVEV